jgi:hypothetical protein
VTEQDCPAVANPLMERFDVALQFVSMSSQM